MKWPLDLRLDADSVRQAVRAASERIAARMPPMPIAATTVAAPSGVVEVTSFGPNPGNLRMNVYAPATPPRAGGPLVVVLHGCTQDAGAFAADSGWIAAADRLGVPLLLPGQRRENNQGGCFSWFQPGDTSRDRGEAASVRSMVDAAIARFGADPRRVYLVGLSAGGAMTAALLAAYPDAFAAGAVVAGLPVGAASTVSHALTVMRSGEPPMQPATLAARVTAAGPPGFAGPWPRLSVWTGEADHTVNPANALALAQQWAAVYGLDADAPVTDQPASGVRRDRWGAGYVELWRIDGMAHGYPVLAGHAGDGRAARFVLDAPVSATDTLARAWALGQT